MRYFLIILLAACHAALAQPGDGLDSLLNAQRTRAGARADSVFSILDQKAGLSTEEFRDLRFLTAYLPLSDLAMMSGRDLLDNVQLAQTAHEDFAWGAQVSDELYRYFVLPHRVSQEPFVHWREKFFNEIGPRVKNLSMTEAALEVNHWCHEHATYQPSDSRDQDPLTTIRAGLGRCEEEMILAICALRAVGIPARQCYTPYWAHTDDNHAWVEVWTDGKWHYFGACEPEPKLDRAWFSTAAARAMLVVSTAYGDYRGSEPVLKRYTRSTLINSTAVYGNTRTLEVILRDEKGIPLPQQNAMFNLYNYGVILPAMALETDAAGKITLVCGKGDWIVSAGKDKYSALALVGANENYIELQLNDLSKMQMLHEVEYTPPPEVAIATDSLRDSLFACRIEGESKLREQFWNVWADEAEINLNHIVQPDSLQLLRMASGLRLDGAKLYEILQKARGNWGNIYRFLFGCFPSDTGRMQSYNKAVHVRSRFELVQLLTDKDCRDFSAETLSDHYSNTTCEKFLENPTMLEWLATLDSTSKVHWKDAIIKPRLNYEPSLPWRRELFAFLAANPKLVKSDERLARWLEKNITVDKDRDRLGAPLTPAQTLELKRGSDDDRDRLYAGLLRVRGIPARFDPVSSRLEKWDTYQWKSATLRKESGKRVKPTAKGTVEIVTDEADTTAQKARFNREWGVQVWRTDHFEDIDLGFENPLGKQMNAELPEGLYLLTSGARRKDGSATIRLEWFNIKAGKPVKVEMRMPKERMKDEG